MNFQCVPHLFYTNASQPSSRMTSSLPASSSGYSLTLAGISWGCTNLKCPVKLSVQASSKLHLPKQRIARIDWLEGHSADGEEPVGLCWRLVRCQQRLLERRLSYYLAHWAGIPSVPEIIRLSRAMRESWGNTVRLLCHHWSPSWTCSGGVLR